ncbi:transporter substrate-binding domain-containing protein [Acidovorax sp. SUPP2539]|uniref:transporter substrate-binding domain-containing protein n=1 Tax=Acidovorax sp. SUPP2539 TaxID=2920878 RepID=UPI0023DE4F7C|nr:transporter substrate-binding domain-containing protein [Acidovorax sp. SUPP2539]GKS91901.1 transporter substrate-binding domain-containing protein [Acidovorax sp. SUPP2539]
MKIRIAYVDEPPFYWTAPHGTVTGADIDLAETVLRSCGATDIEYLRVPFDALLPGVQQGRWEMNVPIFITPERALQVAFSRPVWALGDGFLVQAGNPKALTSYSALAACADARLGVIAGQVQIASAKAAGVGDGQFTVFKDQPDAIAALQTGKIDAFAATAVGNHAAAQAHPGTQAVAHPAAQGAPAPRGAFSFAPNNSTLREAVNGQLQRYLGSADHRARMASHGLSGAEIDGALLAPLPG